jgi:hypothetical protein
MSNDPFSKYWVREKNQPNFTLTLYDDNKQHHVMVGHYVVNPFGSKISLSGVYSLTKTTRLELRCASLVDTFIDNVMPHQSWLNREPKYFEVRTTFRLWKHRSANDIDFVEYAYICDPECPPQFLSANIQQTLILNQCVIDKGLGDSLKMNGVTLRAGTYSYIVDIPNVRVSGEESELDIYELGGAKLERLKVDDEDMFCEYDICNKKTTARRLTFRELKRLHKIVLL